MLGDENSIGPEDLKDKFKFELPVLNGALKDLNKNWGFTDIICPLTTE